MHSPLLVETQNFSAIRNVFPFIDGLDRGEHGILQLPIVANQFGEARVPLLKTD